MGKISGMNHQSQGNIERYFDSLFHAPGYFLEIGAWDGEHISQTAWLERERAWEGLCVDPFPVNFEDRRCLLCSKAIGIDGLPREFIKVSIDRRHGGDVSYLSGFTDTIQTYWKLIEEHCDYEKTMVDTITFEQLCEGYNVPSYIGFLSVDTEGSELEVFQGIDFSKYKFGLITFEHNFDWIKRDNISTILQNNGYILYKELEYDDIWIDRQLTSNG